MTAWEMAALAGCCAAGAVVQSVSSFGFAVVLVGLLPLLGVDVRDAVVLVTLVVVPNIAIAVWRVREHASLRRVKWLLLGVPIGTPVGVYLLAFSSECLLRGLLGVVLVLAAVEPFFRRGGAPKPERRRWAFLAGVLSGIMGGALSTGGPPIVVYFYRRQWSKVATKACVMLAFVGTITIRVVTYVVQAPLMGKQLITQELLWKAALLAPAVVLGTVAGEWLFGTLSHGGFRRAVAAMLVVCGVYQLGKAAGAW